MMLPADMPEAVRPDAPALRPVKPVQIPRLLLPILIPVVCVMLPIAAAVNVDALHQLGDRAFGSGLGWTLPVIVVGYEFAATGVYFLSPKLLPKLKSASKIGMILGFSGTVGLSILYTVVYGDGDVLLKIGLKPVPSLIAVALVHMLVIVWEGKQEAAEVNAAMEAEAAPVEANHRADMDALRQKQEALEAELVRKQEALDAVRAEADAARKREALEARRRKRLEADLDALRQKQEAEATRKQEAEAEADAWKQAEAVALMRPEAPVEAKAVPEPEAQHAPEADPVASEPEAEVSEGPHLRLVISPKRRRLPRVKDAWKLRALEGLAQAEAAGQNPMKVVPSSLKHLFPDGISNKIISNAVIYAKALWEEGVRPADFRQQEAS